MHKFKAGDRITIKASGTNGTIDSLRFNHNTQEYEYLILWDYKPFAGAVSYRAIDGDNDFEYYRDHVSGWGYTEYKPDWLPTKPECEHKWVEVGFQFTKIVCYHCDIEKPQW